MWAVINRANSNLKLRPHTESICIINIQVSIFVHIQWTPYLYFVLKTHLFQIFSPSWWHWIMQLVLDKMSNTFIWIKRLLNVIRSNYTEALTNLIPLNSYQHFLSNLINSSYKANLPCWFYGISFENRIRIEWLSS